MNQHNYVHTPWNTPFIPQRADPYVLRETDDGWGDLLYRPARKPETQPATLTFIPYYSWANRQEGEMRVWVRE